MPIQQAFASLSDCARQNKAHSFFHLAVFPLRLLLFSLGRSFFNRASRRSFFRPPFPDPRTCQVAPETMYYSPSHTTSLAVYRDSPFLFVNPEIDPSRTSSQEFQRKIFSRHSNPFQPLSDQFRTQSDCNIEDESRGFFSISSSARIFLPGVYIHFPFPLRSK